MSGLTPPDKLPPDDWLKVQRIEKDRSRKEEDSSKEESKPHPILFACLTYIFNNLLNTFFPQQKSQVDTIEKQQLIDDLTTFKKKLQILSTEDQSQNPEFIQQLSELWHNLLEDCNILNITSQKPDLQLKGIQDFIHTIQLYPQSEDHTLGYYLTEYVGAVWLPFPFMEMLKKLHENYQNNPEKSDLGQWLASLSHLLAPKEQTNDNDQT